MRRKDREITDQETQLSFLEEADVLRLAMNDNLFPYIVPVNFAWVCEGERLTIYFHGAPSGKKHDLLAQDNRVAFETDSGHVIHINSETPGASGMDYHSVMGTGLTRIVTDVEEKLMALELLLKRYAKGISTRALTPQDVDYVRVYAIEVENISAKQRITPV